jgi:hypothetical protein
VNRITYPDLVPIISGFTEGFFIDRFRYGFLTANKPDPHGRSGPPYKRVLNDSGR